MIRDLTGGLSGQSTGLLELMLKLVSNKYEHSNYQYIIPFPINTQQ